LVLVAAALLVGSCGSTGPFPDGAFALVVNRDVGIGEERILIAVSGPDGSRLASPDIGLAIRAFPEGDEAAAVTVDAEFIWAIPEVSGLYRAVISIDRAGLWSIEATPDDGDSLEPAPMIVLADPATPSIGERAPASLSVTAADAPLEEITTDPDPDPRFYETSIAEAVSSGAPSVIVFATPRFCTSAVCGPTMQVLRAMAPQYPGINWVHVEVYTNLDDPENLAVVPAVTEWGLPSEPWVFVVDAGGTVIGRFEGVISEGEIAGLIG
jgi:hypothetical protein